MVPASLMGREGVAELSKQVVALFNSGTPPRKVFEYGLAFDLLPLLGEAEEDGWTALERTTIGQVRRVIGGEIPCGITLVGTSVFSGMAANVHLRTVKKIKKSRVERIFKDGGVQLSDKSVARYVPRPRRVEGQGLVHGGRIRTSADEVHLHFWLAMDNLRAAATVAVGCCAALLREQIEAGRREEHQEG